MVAYWRDGQFVLENFLTRRRITADPLAAAILHFFDRYRSERQLCAKFPEYSPASLRKAVRSLVRQSFLETYTRGAADLDVQSEALEEWGEWNPTASFFHFSTKDMRF